MLSPGVGVGVRVCLARQLWALSLGSHRRTVLRKGWGLGRGGGNTETAKGLLASPGKHGRSHSFWVGYMWATSGGWAYHQQVYHNYNTHAHH